MQVVSSKEFATHQDKYFDLALSEDIAIKRGKNLFHLTYRQPYPEQPILEPDDDFRRAISGEEFKRRALLMVEDLDKKYAKK